MLKQTQLSLESKHDNLEILVLETAGILWGLYKIVSSILLGRVEHSQIGTADR
ncbi:hypothetical protein AOT82_1309 [Psychrobacter sp. AntiMn-1]|nr:hypothetical protein AOT82_1309 [Psychrobacter sp. AntiMn-1]